ncbi:DUF4369 domain-containing protein [Mesonia sp.]|uniref:DUF4369 domain-containing protein n=1 Tax=Mesonia sp. TaxID=1960830 RepID=UPI001751B8FF|nr:DUF4369 domain-containing protein [Mesonia sp.]HIB38330.1 DUF4369 domain-containing protein [Mesonia sp.]HIO26280.1 DUF4369 domain-containing protein [Flavobacteriaceae bacterium]
MKKLFLLGLITVFIVACSSKETNFNLSGKVDGLKKGTLYLQKIEDTSIVNIDSLKVDGDPEFSLQANIDEPQILFLYLDKVDGDKNDDIVEFFAEEGEMTINTTLKNFTLDANVNGSKNHVKLKEYRDMMKRFNNQNLDLIKENFEAQQQNDEEKLLAVNKKYESNLRRKYLYTVNYAINNKAYEVSPYIMLTEAFDANTKYLDTVYNSLEKKVRKSKYGKELKSYIKERKKLENLEEKVETEEKDLEK